MKTLLFYIIVKKLKLCNNNWNWKLFSGSVQLRSDPTRARVPLSSPDQLELAADLSISTSIRISTSISNSSDRKTEKSWNENRDRNRIQRKDEKETFGGQGWRKSSSFGQFHSVLSSLSCQNSILELDKSRKLFKTIFVYVLVWKSLSPFIYLCLFIYIFYLLSFFITVDLQNLFHQSQRGFSAITSSSSTAIIFWLHPNNFPFVFCF